MRLIAFLLLGIFSAQCLAVDALVFNCERSERHYVETYELKIYSASKSQKAKVFVDERDLDRSDEMGRQSIKNVLINDASVLISMEAHFPPEIFDGKQYGPGSVVTMMNINRNSGQLRKTETIKGGILSASVGEGTKLYEEKCVAAIPTNEKRN